MKSKINTFIYSFLIIAIFTACNNTQSKKISIQNKSTLNYVSKVVEIPWEKVKAQYPKLDSVNFKIVNAVSKEQIPFQLEYAGNPTIKNILVQVSLSAGSAIELVIEEGKPAEITSKTFGRFVPERFDDFAWENDKIAFRMYGKALEKRGKGNAYGMDVWVKRTDKLILDKRYKKGIYNVDFGDGMDYYHVGYTLGAGNIAPYKNDSIWYSKNYYQYKVLDNGPLRTTFQLDFEPWMVAETTVTATKTVSLDAGTQLNKMAVTYKYDNEEPLPAVIGIIKRSGEGGKELFNVEEGILSYWEPIHGDDGTTGVGVIIPSKVDNMKVRNDQFLAEVEVLNNKPFIYYAGAAWDKAGAITSQAEWLTYLDIKKQELLNSGIEIIFKTE